MQANYLRVPAPGPIRTRQVGPGLYVADVQYVPKLDFFSYSDLYIPTEADNAEVAENGLNALNGQAADSESERCA